MDYAKPSSSPSSLEDQQQLATFFYRTVNDLALSVRQGALDVMTGNEFAQLLLTFDELINLEYLASLILPEEMLLDKMNDIEKFQAKAALVIHKFRTSGIVTEMQLCLLWLDGKGYGTMRLGQLIGVILPAS